MSRFADLYHGWGRGFGFHGFEGQGLGGQNGASVIQVNQSNETVQAEPGTNVFVIGSTSQTGDVINGFTLGQDSIRFAGHVNPSQLTIEESGANTVIMDGTSTIVTLNGVQATSLQQLQPHASPPSVIQVTQSSETIAAPSGKDIFVFSSTTLSGDVITGFTAGEDEVVVHGTHGQSLSSMLTLTPDADGVSTDVDVTSDGHTLVTLQDVLPTALSINSDYIS